MATSQTLNATDFSHSAFIVLDGEDRTKPVSASLDVVEVRVLERDEDGTPTVWENATALNDGVWHGIFTVAPEDSAEDIRYKAEDMLLEDGWCPSYWAAYEGGYFATVKEIPTDRADEK